MSGYLKRNKYYILREIAGVPYLLPTGQMIADFGRGIRMNDTGVYLWRLLEEPRTVPELTELCAEHYGVKAEEISSLKEDIRQFTETLYSYGILRVEAGENDSGGLRPEDAELKPRSPESEDSAVADVFEPKDLPVCKYLKIGGLILGLSGSEEAFSKQFDAFLTEPCDSVHQTVIVRMCEPVKRENEELLLRKREIMILDGGAYYILRFLNVRQIYETQLLKDGSQAWFYCKAPYTDAFREELFHAVRAAFLYLAQRHHMAALHSASLLYRGRAWLFSGSSGTGKSTHTGLWNGLLQTPLINGDLNLLEIRNGSAVVHGLPWCGTSGISDTATYPLGGIVLLKQAKENRIEELSEDRRQLLVSQRFIMPFWTAEQQDCSLRFAEELAGHIMICRLHCNKENSAVTTAREEIDKYLDRREGTDSL